MIKTIAIFTTTRAEFGILSAFIQKLNESPDLNYMLFVGGSHLAIENGYTVDEIKKSGFDITGFFDYQLNLTDEVSIAKSLGIATLELANIFLNYKFDMVCVLGDRYELLSIVSNAIIFRRPIVHIHGGERTEGAIDEQIRHMITKASHIHFAACEEYAQNIISMGEEPWRVYNTGALAIDNIKRIPKKSKEELFRQLNLNPLKDVALVTYHPVTLESDVSTIIQVKNMFESLKGLDIQLVITAPNSDNNRDQIFHCIKENVAQNSNYFYFESLGMVNYLNLIPYCKFVIGNSSSAIIEVPFYKIPVVNIGNRQAGRIFHENIITTDYSSESIRNAIDKALSPNFANELKLMKYLFGDGNAADKMVEILCSVSIDDKILNKKLVFENR